MSADLETKVRNCTVCQEHREAPATALLHTWEWPPNPWSRMHLDYAGPFQGRTPPKTTSMTSMQKQGIYKWEIEYIVIKNFAG